MKLRVENSFKPRNNIITLVMMGNILEGKTGVRRTDKRLIVRQILGR